MVEKGNFDFKAIIDNMDQPCYIVDPVNYEILYANKKLREIYNDPLIGKVCYNSFQGLGSPCRFCTNDKLFGERPISPYIWEHHNEKIDMWFHCFDYAIGWGEGKWVRFEIATNITDQKKAELALIAERNKVQEYLDIAAVMIIILNNKGEIIMINKKGCDILEAKHEDIIGKEWFTNFLPEGDRLEVKQLFTKIMVGESEYGDYYENPILTKMGKEKLIAWHNTLVKDSSGKIIGTLSSGEDITERMKSEQKLKESEEKWRALSEYSPAIIIMMDHEGRVQFINHPGSEHTVEQIIGKTIYDYTLPKFHNIMSESCKHTWQTGESSFYSTEYIQKDGSLKSYDTSIGPVYKNNEIIGLISHSIEVTERREAEKKLRESEQLYRHLFENSLYGIILLDLEGVVADVNSTLEEIIGYKKEELIGFNFFELSILPAEMLPQLKKRFRLYVEGNPPDPIEFQVFRKDRSLIWVNPQISLINLGNKTNFQILVQDISDKKKSQQQLKESEEKFRDITEQNLMGISILQDNVIKYINKAMTDIYGYSVDEVINWGAGEYLKIFAPDSLEFVKEQVIKKQTGDPNQLIHYSVHGIKKTGEFVWVDNFSKTIMYEGRPADIITQIDITEKIEAEQRLKESEEKFKKIFEESPLGIGFSDSEGRMLDVNRGFLDLFGVEKLDDLKNISFFDDPNLIEMRKNKIIEGEITEFRSEFNFDLIRDAKLYKTSKSGIRTFHAIIAPLVIGAKHNYIGIIQDVTEPELAKKELEISEEKYRHAYNQTDFYKDLLAHDIGNILNNIQSSVELYRIWEGNESKRNEREEMIKIIERQVGRGASLISNVRRLSEVEQTQLKIIPVEAKTLLEDVMKPIRGMYEDKTIDLSIEATQDTFILRGGDFLYDVFDNIIRNGVIHNDNKSIKVQIKMYKIQKDEQNYVKLEFMDNGHGISDPRKLSIFERDYQKDRSRGGLGIGLSLVKKIVGLYNGQIWVEDRVPGDHTQGSNFIVLLKEAN